MFLKIINIQNNVNKIYFRSEGKTPANASEKQNTTENQNVNDDTKSFVMSNKKAMIAVAAVGIAGIALAVTHHHFKKVSNYSEGVFIDVLSKSDKKKLKEFESKLAGENASDDIINILSESNSMLQFEAIRLIINKGSKHINENTWEPIFDAVTKLKPTKIFKEKFIVAKTNNLLKNMHEKKLFTPEAIDKILSKIENVNDKLKVNILHNLSDGIFNDKTYNHIEPNFSTEQINKALSILDSVKEKDFVYQTNAGGFIEFTTKINTSGIRYKFNSIYLKNLEPDGNYISEFKKIIENDKLPDKLKLQIISDIYYNSSNKFREYCQSENGLQLYKEMFLALEKNKAAKYSIPNQFITTSNEKFDLGYSIWRYIICFDYENIISLEEKLQFTKKMKKLSETIDIKERWHSCDINNLYNEELRLKSEIFFKNFSEKTTLGDIEKFVDEMLKDYKTAIEHFINTGSSFDNRAKESMKTRFDIFRLTIYKYLQKLKEVKGSKSVEDKIEEFAEKYFNLKRANNYSKRTYSGENAHSRAYDFIKNKTEQTKQQIISFLSNDKDFEELIEKLKAEKLDKSDIKILKRKVALKYHPDKAKTEEEKITATANFQEIYGLITTLEASIY